MEQKKVCTYILSNPTALTSRTGNKNRELPEKWALKPWARLPIAWMASTATAMFTSVISCKQKYRKKFKNSANLVCMNRKNLQY